MRIIHNLILIDLKTGNDFLMANGVNGAVDIIHKREKMIIEKWRNSSAIIPETAHENDLFQNLVKKEYIMCAEEERVRKTKIINMLAGKNKPSLSSSSAWFVLTYNCNFSCPYCYEGSEKSKNTMTKEMVDQIFAINNSIKRIGFFGGEPLLPSNKEIINYIISKAPRDAEYSIISNGYYLEDFLDIFKGIKIANVQITLDGSERMHNLTRKLGNGAPTYQRIISGIEKYVSQGIPVTIRMNLSAHNIADCFEEMQRIRNTDWGSKIRVEMQPLFQTKSQEIPRLYKQLFAENENVVPGGENQILNRLLPLSNFVYRGERLVPMLKACDRDGSARFYDPAGNIYNCILAVGTECKSIGTYYPVATLKEKSFLTRDISKIEKCKSCPYSLFCGGGCPNAIPEDMDVYSPNCSAFIREAEVIIPLIYQMRYLTKNERNGITCG